MVKLAQAIGISRRRDHGSLMLEIVIAMGIVTAVLLPLGFSFFHEQQLARAYYYQAIAMEIIDGEMEILRAGESQAFKSGAQEYPVHCNAVKNLPPGRFTLTITPQKIRLEWAPEKKRKGGKVCREITLRDTYKDGEASF